ncbi:MAG: CPBP family intramembrane metalloprotease [Thermoleophilia bacterium]|nr:CPBP family intramembrane metalloprotease [Thermoleophilia bacterium]
MDEQPSGSGGPSPPAEAPKPPALRPIEGPELRSPWAALAVGLLTQTGFWFTNFAAGVIVAWLGLVLADAADVSVLASAVSGAAGSLALYWVLAARMERRRCTELGGGLRGVAEGLVGLLLGVLPLAVPLAIALGLDLAEFARFRNWNWFRVTTDALLVASISAVYQEVIFRGLLLRYLRLVVGLPVALAVSSLAFAAVHFLNGSMPTAQFLAYAVSGLALGAAFVATGRLWMPIAMHAAYNFFLGVNFGTEEVHPLIGWAFTRVSFLTTGDGWLVVEMVVDGVVAGILLAWWWRRSRRRLDVLPAPR